MLLHNFGQVLVAIAIFSSQYCTHLVTAVDVDTVLNTKYYYYSATPVLWNRMQNPQYRKCESGFPRDASMDVLFPHVDSMSGQRVWPQIFKINDYFQIAQSRDESKVLRDFWMSVTLRLDVMKKAFFAGSSHAPSIEDLV